MLRKKETLTIITPIPGFIPRQLAIDILHSHSEVITLNPLVLEHKPIKAPRDAAADEYYSTWYEIIERIQYLPGLGKMGSGKISFNGCFHNMPWGLQTHIYAPMNVDLRNKYRIAGNQPGYEPPEQPEIGLAELGAPSDGLYLREDIEIKCNIAAMSFVKGQLKAAGKEMVSRIIKKAELLDAGVLQAMIEDGRLKTFNPSDRSQTLSPAQPSPTGAQFQVPPMSPRMPYQVPRPQSMQNYRPGTPGSQGFPGYPTPPPGGYAQSHPGLQAPTELPLSANAAPAMFPMELPGDYYHPQVSPNLQPPSTPGQMSTASRSSPDPHASGGQWSTTDQQSSHTNSRPTSISSETTGQPQPFRSPGLDHKGFSSELSTHKETREEHRGNAPNQPQQPQQPQHLQPQQQQQQQQQLSHLQKAYTYNPQDYAKMSGQLPQQGPRYNYAQ